MKKDLIELFVPGRLCLFGEHSDWAGKYRTMNADIVPGAAIVSGTNCIGLICECHSFFILKSSDECM